MSKKRNQRQPRFENYTMLAHSLSWYAANQDSKMICINHFQVDVSKFNEVHDIRVHIENEIGTVDILVNNAAKMSHISLLEGSPEDIEKIIGINLVSSFWVIFIQLPMEYWINRKCSHRRYESSYQQCMQWIRDTSLQFHRYLVFTNGNGNFILFNRFILAYDAMGRQLVYSSTKYALRGLMEGLQEELRIDKSNIVATTVFPGFINTRKDLVAYMDESMKWVWRIK